MRRITFARYILLIAFCILTIASCILLLPTSVLAAPGDTLVVQTINFADTLRLSALTYALSPPAGGFHTTQENYYQGGTYLFPSGTIRFEKILMNFKLKCDPANNPACGQWDFIGYIYAYKDTNRYELGRYETPFGINLNLGNGFTWTYDVSDFRTILYDSVSIKYMVPNQGQTRYELIDLQFIMIKGIPPRDVIKIETLDVGAYRFGDPLDPIESHLPPITVNLLPNARTTKIRATVEGEGWGGSTGCAEFCPKQHWIDVNGVTKFSWLQWKNDCSLNPLYPQGGTWIYNRSNRCPGEPDIIREFELTPFVTGSSITLQYHIEPFSYPGDGAFWACYTIETQLVSYGSPNFTLDAAIWDIKAPSKADAYKRMNPICCNPLITIKNTGATSLTSLTITYGIEGGPQSNYNWIGNLPFLHTEDVSLPPFKWSNGTKFSVTVSNPNGGMDQYPNNNNMKSDYVTPPLYPSGLVFDLLTDQHYMQYGAKQGSYTIKDQNGITVWQRTNNLLPSTTYKDTLNLASGCYEFRFIDDWGVTDPNGLDAAYYNQGDGMTNWPDQTNTAGHMYIRRASNGAVLKNFNMDFGRELYMQFAVGNYTDVPEVTYEDIFNIYPNPSNGKFIFEMKNAQWQRKNGVLEIYDLLGKRVYQSQFINQNFEINLNLPGGIYFYHVKDNKQFISSGKLIIR